MSPLRIIYGSILVAINRWRQVRSFKLTAGFGDIKQLTSTAAPFNNVVK